MARPEVLSFVSPGRRLVVMTLRPLGGPLSESLDPNVVLHTASRSRYRLLKENGQFPGRYRLSTAGLIVAPRNFSTFRRIF